MKLFSSNSFITKTLSITLMYSMILGDLVSFASTIDPVFNSDILRVNPNTVAFDSFENTSSVNVDHSINRTSIKNEILTSELVTVSTSSSGIGQTETTGTTANLESNLVNKFTGDMNYSLPLLDIEGFPIVLTYNPDITMDQEASWVGLGWNLSLGAVNREMRGIPDEFMGEEVEVVNSMLENRVDGKSDGVNVFGGPTNPMYFGDSGPVSQSAGLSISGGIHFSWGTYFNNYTGEGKTYDLGLNASMAVSPLSINTSLGFSGDTQNGTGINKGFGWGLSHSLGSFGGMGVSGSYSSNSNTALNSRSGVKTVTKNSGWGLSGSGSILGTSYSASSSWGKGSFRTFGTQTIVPRFSRSTIGSSNFDTKGYQGTLITNILYAGGGYIGTTHSWNNNSLATTVKYPAYGYKHYSKGNELSNAMLDFNRDQTTNINKESKVLSFSTPTFDMYYCNAPGISASYRPQRYDVVEYHDPIATNTMTNGGVQSELATDIGLNESSLFTGGITGSTQTVSGTDLSSTGGALNTLPVFKGIDPEGTFNNEEFYIKPLGERKAYNNTVLNLYGDKSPAVIDVAINEASESISLSGLVKHSNGMTNIQNVELLTPIERPDNTVHIREIKFSELGRSETVSRNLYDLCPTLDNGIPEPISSASHIFYHEDKLEHHIASVEAVNPNGMRYVFGFPSYTYAQSEVTMSVAPIDEAEYNSTGLVEYDIQDASVSNDQGRFHAFEKTTLPAHSTAHLLTEMYSSDYVDRGAYGPGPEDLGNYFKINYTNPFGYKRDAELGDVDDTYLWRLPLNANENNPIAYANKNFHTDQWDDMGNYMFGEKDVWYASSVESKNLIAIFCLEDRKDQFSAINEHGGLNLNKAGKLIRKIFLYSKNDLENNPDAKPLQIVEFDYNYTLCQGYEGNRNAHFATQEPGYDFEEGNGKLTLTAIYSYSGKSMEGRSTPMEFEYGQSQSIDNPIYARNSSDRWGNYKPNDINAPNHEFPYAEQNSVLANENIQAWKIKKINKVGGESIAFTFEADNYAYVQDHRAMRMFEIEGMSNLSVLNTLESGNGSDLSIPNLDQQIVTNSFRDGDSEYDYSTVVYIKLDEAFVSTGVEAEDDKLFRNQFLKNHKGKVVDDIYFNMYSQLDNHVFSEANEGMEYVESVAKIWKNIEGSQGYAGFVGNGSAPYEYGYVILKPEDINKYSDDAVMQYLNEFLELLEQVIGVNISPIVSQKVNPLQIANWQFARLNAPCNVYGDIDYAAGSATDFCDYHLENDNNLFGANLYKTFNNKNYGVYFNQEKSRIRLFEPDDKKIGGGYRVATIEISDNWNSYSAENSVSGEETATYKYNYTYEDKDENPSGVASNEPNVGINESALYKLLAYNYEMYLLPNETAYQKDPWGSLVYPGATVGYSGVSSSLFDGTQVGSMYDSYFTLKDFPTIARKTEIQKEIADGEDALEDKDKYITEINTFSQGFYIETSDFHGQPKRSVTFGGQGEVISSSSIEYYDENSEEMSYVSNNGGVINSKTPRDVDIYADSWVFNRSMESVAESEGGGVGISLYPGVTVTAVPLISINVGTNNTKYKQHIAGFTFNKVVNHYAVPKTITTSYLGSHNSARNLFFDAHTGEVIVSSLQDEFDDTLYSMTYPSHWKYNQLDNASRTDGAYFRNSLVSSSTGSNLVLTGDLANSLTTGDELTITHEVTPGNEVNVSSWILEKSGSNYSLIASNGTPLTGINWSTAKVTVKKTARKNRLMESMMSITAKNAPEVVSSKIIYPGNDNSLNSSYNSDLVYSSSAINYQENKNYQCRPEELDDTFQRKLGDVINPFTEGVKGNFRMKSSFAIQDERTSISGVSGNNAAEGVIRKDGAIENYFPFYARVGDEWFDITEVQHPRHDANNELQTWRELGQMDEYDEFGKPIQSTNQIGVSNAVQYGMTNNLKIMQKASVVNAESNEFGFEGFEDYNYDIGSTGYVTNDFSLIDETNNAVLTYEDRHSGKYSLKIANLETFSFPVINQKPANTSHIINDEYIIQDCDCLTGFSPYANEAYWVSVWVKETNTTAYPYQSSKVTISANGSSSISIDFTPTGQIIDGWQKIEGKFTLPSNATEINIVLANDNASGATLFDDFRIHPFEAGMTTTVYDQNSLLPIATHDAYNYTTFYSYDENYQLVRVRVETIEGIMTISEFESGNYRK